MGQLIGDVSADSPEAFRERLRLNLAAAKEVLSRPGFGVGETTIGAELELSLVDAAGRPMMCNQDVLATMDDHHMTVELDRFNLEFNADPVRLAGRSFDAVGAQLDDALDRVDAAGEPLGARCISIGTLPSLDLETLAGDEAMTDLPRYRALAGALRGFRGKAFELNISGLDPLTAKCDGVTLEGANTSFQLHLRVPPARFADTYNAAQLATPVALAVSGNSPTFCGHRLWEETRIAVFKQAVDLRSDGHGSKRPPRVCFGHGWTREGILELLSEAVHLHEPLLPRLDGDDAGCLEVARAGGVPSLRALRLHLGTIWGWNRPVFDTSGEGHLRVELRALPSGPTVIDMMASSAFYLGLILGLRDRVRDLLDAVPFEFVRGSFYRAAQNGLDAELAWPSPIAPSPSWVEAAALAHRLLPVARQGLVEAGVNRTHADELLAIIDERVARRRTGASWQRLALSAIAGEQRASREALEQMTLEYLERSRAGDPVHTWGIPSP